jgi:hypothetical protein
MTSIDALGHLHKWFFWYVIKTWIGLPQAWNNQVPCTDKRYVITKVAINFCQYSRYSLLVFLHVLDVSCTCTWHGPTVINCYVLPMVDWWITIHAHGEFISHWTRCNNEEMPIALPIYVCSRAEYNWLKLQLGPRGWARKRKKST